MLVDGFMKFAHKYPIDNKHAKTIANIIFYQFIAEHGVIEDLHTD